jgi:2-keto-4-pentenoate hydratase/2-oxohepta-3-ene-1,7-dioic acid hydratase in catechol pathway
MKLLRIGERGQERPALWDGARLRDLQGLIADVGGDALLPSSLDRLRKVNPRTLPIIDGSPRIGCCVGAIGKVVCVGLNYRDHAIESNLPIPSEPILFLKATSSISGPNDDVEIPPGAEKVDWEAELGVVIGEPAKYVSVERAMAHVAGYCVVNDVSERSYQLERGGLWDKGKGCDTFAPIGPWLVTQDEIEDVQELDIWLDVEDERVQAGNTRTMIFDVAHLVSYISQFMSLRTGDVIATGTPPGVGMGHKPPRFLRAGQSVRVGIAGLGIQTQRMVAARRP